MAEALTFNHKTLDDAYSTRRYFAKFERIIPHLRKVSELSVSEGQISEAEARIIQDYLAALGNGFAALSYKYLMAGRLRAEVHPLLRIDKRDSGFPVYSEILQMATDALQADKHLARLPSRDQLKKDMVRHVLNEGTSPIRLQYAMAQREYYERIFTEEIFWAQNDPQAFWQRDIARHHRAYLVHWAKYDSQTNVPAIYVMMLEDTGRRALPTDERRWPEVQQHLMAQSVSALKLLTIAKGFDEDFDDLHPKLLRRFHLGPMYSHHFTEQEGPLRDILAEASGVAGLDWALAWTVETLRSKETRTEKSGFFSSAEREVFALDHLDPAGIDAGATDTRRALIMPHRAYQTLEEADPPGLAGTRRYVVGKNDRILSYR